MNIVIGSNMADVDGRKLCENTTNKNAKSGGTVALT